jgi:aquaporin Z
MNVLHKNYPEYLMEAAGLGIFMFSVAVITALLEHPDSPIRQPISDPVLRRFVIGVAMGLTAIALIYSPWGKQSGAHLNPVVTLTFFRLGKVRLSDALFYVISQFVGGWSGIWLAARILREAIVHPSVNYVVTVPGSRGAIVAFLAELMISFGVMITILIVSNTTSLSRFTGIFAGVLVATYITLEAPLSGMSMNPARTLASAIPAETWTAIWIYFTAPLLGMLGAAEVYLRLRGRAAVRCAKLHHHNRKRCIFHCGYRSQFLNSQYRELSDQLPH